MENITYLLNLGFFYCAIIPSEKKCYLLNVENSNHSDVQSFLNGEEIDFSKYKSIQLPYDKYESWTSYLESQNPVTYYAEKDLSEEAYFDRLTLKKHADGLLVAVKDPKKQKVKVFRKNVLLGQG
ncbi:hypothetical protein [Flavivirga jejuensis]|uniref:Uncharacterized protein n=1 Tax=Flavivirga jejuensis TaxID=870487 RepID=A0ABT8WUZ6_9FLAO|nr:hypothetical protein [Flavivirga jejuensis]MDO5976969.1 hypothetical protein [Flavivirga jejuensis]